MAPLAHPTRGAAGGVLTVSVSWLAPLVGAVAVLAIHSSVASAIPLSTHYDAGSPYESFFGITVSHAHDPTEGYAIEVGGVPHIGVTTLMPSGPEYLRSVTDDALDIIMGTLTEDAWTFASSLTELSDDSLVVHTYDAIGTTTFAGAWFQMDYVPHGTDPTADLHWIQVVWNNHNNTDNQGHGNPEHIVDGPDPPYYDNGAAADAAAFLDESRRNDPSAEHDWVAELYLVQGPDINPDGSVSPGPIVFYGGARWGWQNRLTAVPEPSILVLLLIGVVGLAIRRPRSGQ